MSVETPSDADFVCTAERFIAETEELFDALPVASPM